MKNNQKIPLGFSIFEVLVSISVILVLSIFSIIFIPRQIIKARDSRIKSDLYKMYLALEDYYDTYNTFPESLPDCNQPLVKDGHVYLVNVPCDPYNKQNYNYVTSPDSTGSWFKIYANIQNSQDSIISIIGCSNGCGDDCQFKYGVSSTNVTLDKCHGPDQVIYACSPGGGSEGHCEQYDDPNLSQCPKTYINDETCNNECSTIDNRCKNSAGKHQPE